MTKTAPPCVHCSGDIVGTPRAQFFCSVDCVDGYAKTNPRHCEFCGGVIEIDWSFADWRKATVCQECKKRPRSIKKSDIEAMAIEVPDGIVAIGRWDVLTRDGCQCIYCGASPAKNKVVLHVDHVVPLSKGGKNIASNLVAACEDCNLTKMARRLPENLEARIIAEIALRNEGASIAPDALYAPHYGRVQWVRQD